MLLARRLPRFERKLDHLSKIISDVDAIAQRKVEHVFCAEKTLLQLQIEWELFVRNLILDSATGLFSNSNGPVASQKFQKNKSRESIAHTLAFHEQRWHLPKEAAKTAINLQISNSVQISAELGIPWQITDLRFIRNFIVHKSKSSALEVRKICKIPQDQNIDVLDIAFQYHSAGVKRYQNWINFSKDVARRLVA